jgi:transposase
MTENSAVTPSAMSVHIKEKAPVEAAQVTVRSLPEWRNKYCHLTLRQGRKIAKVAMARKLAVRLYWMMRKEWDYERLKKFGSYAGKPGYRDGVK